MHFNKGDKVDFYFYEISVEDGGCYIKNLKHGIVVWWNDMGFGSANVKGNEITFASGNVVNHKFKDPDEVNAFTVWQENKPLHFHHKANALKVFPKVQHIKYDLSVLTEEERSHFFSD